MQKDGEGAGSGTDSVESAERVSHLLGRETGEEVVAELIAQFCATAEERNSGENTE
jgi:hypothetical protein